jgi:pyruvate/2-oxoglutarate dehydrogenase complex dihydrolipoamide acyltransferase (E2) component
MGESLGLPVRMVVAPAGGRLRLLPPARFQDGQEWVSAGQTVAVVENGPVIHEVRAPHEARVAGVLVRDGEPVAPGQPLVWLDESVRPPEPIGADAPPASAAARTGETPEEART